MRQIQRLILLTAFSSLVMATSVFGQSVSIISPLASPPGPGTNLDLASEPFTIEATALGVEGTIADVDFVDFLVDDGGGGGFVSIGGDPDLVDNDTQEGANPYSIGWSPGVTGTFDLKAEVTDFTDVTAESNIVTVRVVNTDVDITITSPDDSDTFPLGTTN